jgi:hypothetical protein
MRSEPFSLSLLRPLVIDSSGKTADCRSQGAARACARLFLATVILFGAGGNVRAAGGEIAFQRTIDGGTRGSELFQAVNGIYGDRGGIYLTDGPGGKLVSISEQGTRSHAIEGAYRRHILGSGQCRC